MVCEKIASNFQCYTILRPVTALCALGCSIFSPSISQRYCCGVNRRTSFSFCGRWYAPAPAAYSLYSRMHPSRSLQNSLMQSRRLPQNRNSVLVNGSGLNRCCTMAATPIDPLPRQLHNAGALSLFPLQGCKTLLACKFVHRAV